MMEIRADRFHKSEVGNSLARRDSDSCIWPPKRLGAIMTCEADNRVKARAMS